MGDTAWGIQFHAEVTPEDADAWIQDDREKQDAARIVGDFDALRERTRAAMGTWNELGRGSATGFWPRRLLGREVGGREAAVDQEGRGGDVGGVVTGQEQRRLRDLAGLAEAAHRHVHEPALGLLGLGGEELGESGV